MVNLVTSDIVTLRWLTQRLLNIRQTKFKLQIDVYSVFWIRARYNAFWTLTHQGHKWIKLKMPDKIPEFYPLQYRALDACANPKYCNLRATWNNTCNFAYVAKFGSLWNQDKLIPRSQSTRTKKKFTFSWYFFSFLLQYLFSRAVGSCRLTTWRLMAGLPGFTACENSLHLSAGYQWSNVTDV